MPKLLRGHCLALSVVELTRRHILVDDWLSHGAFRLFKDDRDDEQVQATAQAFLSGGGGILSVVWERGSYRGEVTSRATAIRGYRQWLLTCEGCGRGCRKLLVAPSGRVACGRCLGVRYPDQRRQRSWASSVWLAVYDPGAFTRQPGRQEGLYRWGVGEIRRLGLKR
ncbi:hypothetical protein [Paludisphaera mucosa]|uniref:Uncharacterized protein n=1 Tax=Paludisphaera mucosa TaxID=3030827 RepID=A0ABT6FES6_9BACT|nr:hypothetical protein [Paludisphaera mucosa]MDG3006084.1 hypothetical protein [Paludisphaera mucosa]